MIGKNDTPQIHYSSWYDKTAPKDYFQTIDTIAEWIGYALEGHVSGYAGNGRRLSTICVTTTKEKFGDCRVYVMLTHGELVASKWESEGNSGEASQEFLEKCEIENMKHYRCVHRDACFLWPQYARAITCCADYDELFCETLEEFEAQYASNGTIHDIEHIELVKKSLK